MDLTEIISDAIAYPINNIKALILYILIGFIIGIVAYFTGLSQLTGGSLNFQAGFIVGILGLIIIIGLSLLLEGYSLDIIKTGINRQMDAPEIEFDRQVINGVKYLIVSIVYMIIPIVLLILGSVFNSTIFALLGLILMVVFAFALTIAICRLAKTEELGYALDFIGVYDDIQEIGIFKIIITLIVAIIVGVVIVFAFSFILGMLLAFIGSNDLLTIIVTIFSTILDACLLFYMNRVMGLLYSHKA
jgi:hypothetical protein